MGTAGRLEAETNPNPTPNPNLTRLCVIIPFPAQRGEAVTMVGGGILQFLPLVVGNY